MERLILHRKKVYDPVLRLLHASIGLSIVVLILTAWISDLFEKGPSEKSVWMMHIFAGYVLAGGFGLRILWGFMGPAHARWSRFWRPREALDSIRSGRIGRPKGFGHDPLVSFLYLGVYGLVGAMVVTGLGLAAVEHGVGPLKETLFDAVWLEEVFEEPHEVMSNLILVFIGLHLGAIIWHERKDRIPIAQSMVSGYQYRQVDPAVETHRDEEPDGKLNRHDDEGDCEKREQTEKGDIG